MTYVFDTNSFRELQSYFPQNFPTFWANFDTAVTAGQIISVREVLNELEFQLTRDHMIDWVAQNRRIFKTPTAEETEFVANIFQVQHFAALVEKKQIYKGGPVADPFVIASAAINSAVVVTEEALKPKAAKIPNVCEHFDVPYTNLEQFLEQQGWTF